MALYWLSGQDPDEKGFFQVDWTDEMDATSDTINGTPTFASAVGDPIGVRFSGIAIATGSKKVNVYIDNTDPDANRAALLAASPLTDIVHTVTTAGGQTLVRTISLFIEEGGSDLTVEDGSALAAADTYDTLAAADLYHAQRGNTDWVGTDLERARELRRGFQMFNAEFLGRIKGSKVSSTQAGIWPRQNVTDEDGNVLASDTIPANVKYAQFELARLLDKSLSPDIGASIREAHAGSVGVTFATAREQRTIYDHVHQLMRAYMQAGNVLVRA